jgi:hypothetical protein
MVKAFFLAHVEYASVPEINDNVQKRQLPSTRTPMIIKLRPATKGKLRFQLPFVPQDKYEYPSDARCVLQVWELDRYKSLVRGVSGSTGENDESVNKDNELLGEIEGFVKQTEKRTKKSEAKFIFVADQNLVAPSDLNDQKKQRITIKINRIAEDRISIYLDDWVLDVTGEIETRLEIGISMREVSEKIDFKTREFPYPVLYLHKISQPPNPDEIKSVWKEKWNVWKYKQKLEHIGCDVAARQVSEVMGGRWKETTIWRRPTKGGWYRCTMKDGDEAFARWEAGFEDALFADQRLDGSIESVVCRIYKGKPYTDVNGVKRCESDDHPLKPGYLIYTAESCLSWPCNPDYNDKAKEGYCFNCAEEPGSGWLWHYCHFVMYHDYDVGTWRIWPQGSPHYHKTGMILDTVNLNEPTPRIFKPWYAVDNKTRFVVLRIHDPFTDMR